MWGLCISQNKKRFCKLVLPITLFLENVSSVFCRHGKTLLTWDVKIFMVGCNVVILFDKKVFIGSLLLLLGKAGGPGLKRLSRAC
jgi:hypothetical protein